MYRTVDAAMWTDPKVKKMDPRAKLAFLYLITNPHTHVSGIYYLPAAVACYETGMSARDWDRVCDTLSRLCLVKFDRAHEVVWVVNMMTYQGTGERNEKSAAYHLHEDLHNSPLVLEFLEKYPAVRRHVKNGWIDRVSHRVSEVCASVPLLSPDTRDLNPETKDPPTPQPGEGSSSLEELPAIPGELDTPEFREAWDEWLAMRREKRDPVTPRSAKGALKKMLAWGVGRAVAALWHSIGNGWKGIFEPDAAKGGTNGRLGGDVGSGSRVRAGAGKYAGVGRVVDAGPEAAAEGRAAGGTPEGSAAAAGPDPGRTAGGGPTGGGR